VSCIFCRIVAGDAPASFIYRDDVVSAFMDLQPVTPGHLLVIPNAHGAYMSDIDEETAAHLMRVGHRLDAALRASGLRCEGVNFFVADGEAAMQEVFHVHLHLIPRFKGDEFGLRLPPGYPQQAARSDLDANADRIRAQLDGEGTQ
jgi:histidine triad (HIT) family protein